MAVAFVGVAVVLLMFGAAFLLGFVSYWVEKDRRQGAPPVIRNGPNFRPAFEPMKFPDIPRPEIPKGPDIDKIIKESNERMEQHLQESRKQQEELMEKLRSNSFGPPERFNFPPDANSPSGSSGLEEARKRAEEARQRSQERLDALKERMKSRP